MHKVSTKIVPLVVGSLGVVTKNLEKNLKILDIPDVLGSMHAKKIYSKPNSCQNQVRKTKATKDVTDYNAIEFLLRKKYLSLIHI